MLATERLLLRKFNSTDANFLFEMNNNRHVLQYTGDKPFESLKHASQFIESYQAYEEYGFGRWMVLHLPNVERLGWCGFKQHEEYIDLGFRFSQKYWNNGYATEAARACLHADFTKQFEKPIVGRCHPENKASIRVLEKIGMVFWKYQHIEELGNCLIFIKS